MCRAPRTAMAAVHRVLLSAVTVVFLYTPAVIAQNGSEEPDPDATTAISDRYAESMTVEAIRAEDETPVTSSEMPRERIEEIDYGQDIPLMLTRTPSVLAWADAGSGGSGYSYFSIRGIGTTRINMTLDGVPLNDPAENALYFANFVDFASNVDSIQIQRGVGTSTVGSPSYGGSINFASLQPREDERVEGYIGGGSFGQQRASVAWHSGRFADVWKAYVRGSYNTTDGYREHSGVEQHSFWLGAEREGENMLLRVFGFSGREKSQLAFYATDEETLRSNPRFNPLHESERDEYGQDLFKIELVKPLSSGRSVAATAYYHGAQGWFGILADPTDLTTLQRYETDGHFVGLIGTLHEQRGNLSIDAGVHVNDFTRDHSMRMSGERQYLNTGDKNEANVFAKANWTRGDWVLYGDAQVRWARFVYEGDVDLGSVSWTFFNPKIGARYHVNERSSVYASLGRAEREPTRADMLFGEDNATIAYDLEAVRPENVVDLELGWDYSRTNLSLSTTLYAMEFRDEIALTGELSEIGLPTRTNVDRSWRRGLELEAAWRPAARWVIRPAINLSRNRIEEWTQFYDIYDENFEWIGSAPRTHRDVTPLLTPEQIVNLAVEWYPASDLRLEANGRWVSESHLDNTGDERFVTPEYTQLDLAASVGLQRWLGDRAPTARLNVVNVLDEDEIWPSGYSYPYIVNDDLGGQVIEGINYYYPMSTRSVSLTLDWRL